MAEAISLGGKSEEIAKEQSEELSEELSEKLSEELSEELSEKLSEELSKKLSEELSEEKPEEVGLKCRQCRSGFLVESKGTTEATTDLYLIKDDALPEWISDRIEEVSLEFKSRGVKFWGTRDALGTSAPLLDNSLT